MPFALGAAQRTNNNDSQAVSNGLKSLLGIPDPRNLLSRDVSVKDFSHFLGYTVQQGREIIDQAYSELYPAYSIFYSNHRTAEDIVDRFQALHLIYRLESNDRVAQFTGHPKNIVQMPLTVRYMLKGTKPTVAELFRVRCKLAIPSYTASTECFEYDGYIRHKSTILTIGFLKTEAQKPKLCYSCTDSLQIIRQHHEGDS